MKKTYLIHGWSYTSDSNWYPWLKSQLESKGFSVEVPEMPDTEEPKIDKWLAKLQEIAPNPDEQTYFVGHSIGCQAILRYLELFSEETKIGGVLLVAPWLHLKELETKEEKEIAKPWLETPIDFEKVKTHTNNFTTIFSNNDQFVPLSDKDIFKEMLGAEVIVEQEKGHFDDDSDIKQLPSALNSLIDMSG